MALLSLLPFSGLIALARELKLYGYGFAEPEVLMLAGGVLLVTLAIGALALAGPPVLRRMLVVGVILHLILMEQITSHDPLRLHLLPIAARIAIFLAVVLAVGWVVWRLKDNAPLVLAAVLGTTLLGLLVEAALLRESRAAGLLSTAGGVPPPRTEASARPPPVVHVILDAHIGAAGIPRDLPGGPEAAAAMAKLYTDLGFALYPRAFSQFAESQFAIPVMMNASRPDQLFESVEPRLVPPFGFVIRQSRWLERLKQAGYRLTVYQNLWVDYCNGMPELIDRCHTYPAFGPSGLRDASVPRVKKLEILSRYWAHRFLPWGIVEVPPVSPLNSLRAFDQLLDDIAAGPSGNAYLVHLLVPHDGFILDEACKPVAGFGTWREDHTPGRVYNTEAERRDRYVAYLRQVHCANRLVSRLIEALAREGVLDRATVIVHGDHGSRVARVNYKGIDPTALSDRDMVDHFSTLYAVRAPGLAPGTYDERATIQDLFARHLLGEARPPSGDTVYMRKWPTWHLPPLTRSMPPL